MARELFDLPPQPFVPGAHPDLTRFSVCTDTVPLVPHNPIEADERARSVGAAMTMHEHLSWRGGVDRLKKRTNRLVRNNPRSREEVAILDRDVHVFHAERFDHLSLLEPLGVSGDRRLSMVSHAKHAAHR